jgi:hypothetical protein
LDPQTDGPSLCPLHGPRDGSAFGNVSSSMAGRGSEARPGDDPKTLQPQRAQAGDQEQTDQAAAPGRGSSKLSTRPPRTHNFSICLLEGEKGAPIL